MSVRPIVQIGDPVLRQRASVVAPEEIASPKIQSLVKDLIDTMRHANGAGLAAPQIGVPLQVCVIEVKDNPRYPYKPRIPLTVLVNPTIEALGEERFDNYEGCLSVPNLRGIVSRAVEIRLCALNERGELVDQVVRGLSAGTFAHECDHLHGTLFVDRVEDRSTLCTWDMFEAHYRDAFVERVEALVARFGS